jgi:hypothetical protein
MNFSKVNELLLEGDYQVKFLGDFKSPVRLTAMTITENQGDRHNFG